ncbi:hypothetical protein RDABS01_036769 [Bienertia sinuspersici]
MPSIFSSLCGYFSNSRHKVACEKASNKKGLSNSKPKIKNSSAPIPASYFPVGSRLSRL